MPERNVQRARSSCARWQRHNRTASEQGVLGRRCAKGSTKRKTCCVSGMSGFNRNPPDFHFFAKCRGVDPRKQDFGQDAIQRTLRTCRQPISDNRLQMLRLFEAYQQCSFDGEPFHLKSASRMTFESGRGSAILASGRICTCLLYTSPSPRDVEESRMPSSA